MDWMVPRHRLDAEQLAMLNEIQDGDGNYFVKGFPGTGKSVLLAHAYRDYRSTHPNSKICVLTYTRALAACLKDGIRDENAEIYTIQTFCTRLSLERFDLVLVDEAQDMHPEWGQCISRMAERIILFGDFGQSIYGGCLTEQDLLQIFCPKVLELRTIYRLTKSLKELVQSVFPNRPIEAEIGRLVADTDIQLLIKPDHEDENKIVAARMGRYARPQKPSAILFAYKGQIIRFLRIVCPELPPIILGSGLNDNLRKLGYMFRFLGLGFYSFEESDNRSIVYVMTWHSAKGLDFESVALPDLSNGRLRYDPLFYVALTRARRNLYMSYNGDDDSGKMALVERCPNVKKVEDRSVSVAGIDAEDDEIVF